MDFKKIFGFGKKQQLTEEVEDLSLNEYKLSITRNSGSFRNHNKVNSILSTVKDHVNLERLRCIDGSSDKKIHIYFDTKETLDASSIEEISDAIKSQIGQKANISFKSNSN